MQITKVKNFILSHPEVYSIKNPDSITNIKTNKKYIWICEKGHEFRGLPTNIINEQGFHCTVCSGKTVLKGYNDIHTTHPEYSAYLLNYNDGFKYSFGSNKKIYWKCPDCGYIFLKSPNKVIGKPFFCSCCSDFTSYGEKFVCSFLRKLEVDFEMHKNFKWSGKKSYDFYLPDYNCIIEVNGKQHYTEAGFQAYGGRALDEEQKNDCLKYELAKNNGIKYYIEIDARKSKLEWIKSSIYNSELKNILDLTINLSNDFWNEIHASALSNNIKACCELYAKGMTDLGEIAKNMGHCVNTIRFWLKKGASLGWCDYSPKQALKECYRKNGQRVLNTMSKKVLQLDDEGNVIQKYSSLQEAQRALNISHIWDCIKGKRNSAGGYKWKYED